MKAALTFWIGKKNTEHTVYGEYKDINALRNLIIRRMKDSGIPAMAMTINPQEGTA